jgi:acyl carrier protein
VVDTDRIRTVLKNHGRLSVDVATLADGDELYSAGLSSLASVNVMLGLEAAFDIEFPDRMLTRRVFESISSMRTAISELVS